MANSSNDIHSQQILESFVKMVRIRFSVEDNGIGIKAED